MERVQNKNKAMEEFSSLDKYKSSFDEQFLIFRFKKIITDNFDENGGDRVVQMIKFDSHVE